MTKRTGTGPPVPETDDQDRDADGETAATDSGPFLPPGIPATERPDAAFLSSWFSREWERWRDRRDKDARLRDRFYRNTIPDASGPNGEGNELTQVPIRSGIAKTLLREFAGILGADQPRIEALADGVGPVAQLAAAKVEEWDVAWLASAGGDELVAKIDNDQAAYGRGVAYIAWARQYWAGLPTQEAGEQDSSYRKRAQDWKQRSPNPIVARHCPAPQTMFDEDEWQDWYGQPRVVYWCHRRLSELAERYPGKEVAKRWARLQSQKQSDYQQDPWQLFLTFANRRYMVYAVADTVTVSDTNAESGPVALLSDTPGKWELLSCTEHGLGRNPFVVQGGDTSSDSELVNRYAGLFDNSIDLIDRIDEALTQYATAVRRYSRAQPIVLREWGPQGNLPYGFDPATNQVREVTWDPDKVLGFGPGEKPDWWRPDLSAHAAAVELHTLLNQYVQRDTLAPSSWGSGAQSESGYQLVTLIQSSERKLVPLMRRKARALEALLNSAHALVCWIDDPDGIQVYRIADERGDTTTALPVGGWLTLKAQDAQDARIRVTVEPHLDSADAAAAQIGIQIAQAISMGALDIDKDWVLERWFGLRNPERHRRAAMLQRFLQQQPIQDWMTKQVLQQAQMTVTTEDAEIIDQLSSLPPADLMLVPQALQKVLASRGMLPAATPGLAAQVAASGQQAAGGPVPSVPAQNGMMGGDGGSGLNAVLSQVQPPSAPSPGSMPNAPGAPASNAASMFTGGVGRMAQAQGAGQYGQPVSPTQAGQL